MAQKDKGTGFQSAAGLIRYFEEEKSKGPKIDPKLVIYMAIIFAILVELSKVFWPATRVCFTHSAIQISVWKILIV